MTEQLATQYNNFATTFSHAQLEKNKSNRDVSRAMIQPYLSGKKVLDIGCGDGTDAGFFFEQGADVFGIDPSEGLISLARQQNPHLQFDIGRGEKLPYANESFDVVFSKYAIMTSKNMQPIFDEAYRVLIPGGILQILVAHPIRQFLEKKRKNCNYFKQELVESIIFDGEITLIEPTHTFGEYFNRDFFAKFELQDFAEAYDVTAEMVNGAVYPGFMVVQARKK